jgi:hypothetical protein
MRNSPWNRKMSVIKPKNGRAIEEFLSCGEGVDKGERNWGWEKPCGCVVAVEEVGNKRNVSNLWKQDHEIEEHFIYVCVGFFCSVTTHEYFTFKSYTYKGL